jgi:hypothetical protein
MFIRQNFIHLTLFRENTELGISTGFPEAYYQPTATDSQIKEAI